MVSLINATGVHPEMVNPISSCSFCTEQDLLISGLLPTICYLYLLKCNFLIIVNSPGMGQNGIGRSLIVIKVSSEADLIPT